MGDGAGVGDGIEQPYRAHLVLDCLAGTWGVELGGHGYATVARFVVALLVLFRVNREVQRPLRLRWLLVRRQELR